MYNSNSGHHYQQQQSQAQNAASSTGNSSSSSALPPLLLNARLHELVIAGTGQNERLEPALEHVQTSFKNFIIILFSSVLGVE